MLIYDKKILSQQAKELHVNRDTFEKVCRLKEILKFFNESELLNEHLALKGGTAINLLFFNLPRLSVDIDLDLSVNLPREEMMEVREKISALINKYMSAEGYTLSVKTKSRHSLDSNVYEYINSAGTKDNIKIEINYSLRSHVLPIQKIKISGDIFNDEFEVNTVSPIEIYASKTVALMTRAAVRDLYDMNYMIRIGLFDENELETYRKCVIFYLAVATEKAPLEPDFTAMEDITKHRVLTDLEPVIRNRDVFNLESAKKNVREFLTENIYFNEKDVEFLKKFNKGYYHPELLFESEEILERIKNHPMALWKTKNNRDNIER